MNISVTRRAACQESPRRMGRCPFLFDRLMCTSISVPDERHARNPYAEWGVAPFRIIIPSHVVGRRMGLRQLGRKWLPALPARGTENCSAQHGRKESGECLFPDYHPLPCRGTALYTSHLGRNGLPAQPAPEGKSCPAKRLVKERKTGYNIRWQGMKIPAVYYLHY